MKILVFSWRDPKHPLAGGAEQVMHEHMKGWIEAGHDVTLFASYFKNGKRNEILDGVKIKRYGCQLVGVHIAAFFWYFFGNHPKFDIVVDQFHGIPFFTPIYVGNPKLAVIQETTKEVWFLNHLPKPFNWIIGLVGYLTEPVYFLFYRNTPFMTGSKSTEDDLIKVGIPKENIHIIPHGVILKSPGKIMKEKKKTITFLGALAKDKGIESAISAFSILNKKGDFIFWVIGKGEKSYKEYLLDLAKKLKVYKKIKFWGYVSQSEKFDLLAKSHILVNPSVREGWGLVNIEANSVGTPVVGYKSQGLIDSIKNGESGVLCEKNTPGSLANNVLDILSDKVKYEKLKKDAIKWSKKFNWKQSRKKSLGLIEKMVEH